MQVLTALDQPGGEYAATLSISENFVRSHAGTVGSNAGCKADQARRREQNNGSAGTRNGK